MSATQDEWIKRRERALTEHFVLNAQFEARVRESCAEENVLDEIAQASGDKSVFHAILCNAIRNNSYYGQISYDIEPSPDLMLNWLKDIRNDNVWRGDVPFAKEHHVSFECAFLESGYEYEYDAILYAVTEICDELKDELLKAGTDDAAVLVEAHHSDIFEELQSYGVISAEAHMERTDFRCNIILGCGDEGNSDYGNIYTLRAMMYGETDVDPDVIENNSLSWLIRQQGHTLADIIEGKAGFCASVKDEIFECAHVMNAVTICLRLTPEEVEKVAQNDGMNVCIDKGATIGLFAPWVGGGSLMEIALKKDIVIPKSMINRIQIEEARNNSECTVDSVFGMSGSVWKPNMIRLTGEVPFKLTEEMTQQDANAIIKHIMEHSQSDEEDEDDSPSP